MSSDSNSKKASVAGLKCGVSKIASKAAYAVGVAGGAGLGAFAGSAIGPAGTVTGAIYGGMLANEKMAKSGPDKERATAVRQKADVAVGATVGAVTGATVGGGLSGRVCVCTT